MSYSINNRQYGTLNNPILMVGEDGESYLVKLNPKNDMRIGINELVCSLVGMRLELPVFEPIIAHVSEYIINGDDRLQNHCEGRHFASRYIEPFETINSYHSQGKKLRTDLIGNIGMVPDFIIYDKYIENFDRHGDNVCLLPNDNLTNKVDYYLFDHDLAFQRNEVIIHDIRQLRDVKRRLNQMVFLVSCITKTRFFNRITSKIESLIQDIPDIIKNIPVAWRNAHKEYVDNVETILMKFTKDIADEHIRLNKDRLPYMGV